MNYRGAILDVDGTVVRGDEPIPGADEALRAIESAGLGRVFVSNNPAKRPSAYEDRFARAGLEVSAEEVVTAGTVTARYFREERPDATVYVVGEPGLVEILDAGGVETVGDAGDADVYLASIDRSFDYDTLCEALDVLADDDVAFVGTDPDMVIPGAERDVPGSGAVINAVSGVAEREPDAVLGKPSETAKEMALERLGTAPEETLVVGDRLDTDIALGERFGMTTVLVRTGVTDEETLSRSAVEPDYVLDSVADIRGVLDAE